MTKNNGPVLLDEFRRLAFRCDEFFAMNPQPPALLEKQIARFNSGLTDLETRIKLCIGRQKLLAEIQQIISGADLTVKKDELAMLTPEQRAMNKLAKQTGQAKITRVHDKETVRPGRIDNDYKSGIEKQLFFIFSTLPKPGVYSFPVGGRGVNTSPVYIPYEKTEDAK